MSDTGQHLLFDVPPDPPPVPAKPGPKGPTGPRPQAIKDRASKRREARAARDKSIAQGLTGADPAWLAAAERIALKLAAAGEFTTCQVVAALEAEGVTTREPRALGGVMVGLRKRGEIVATDRFIQTERKSRHAAPVRVWKGAGAIVT